MGLFGLHGNRDGVQILVKDKRHGDCGKRLAVKTSAETRSLIQGLFARGAGSAAFKHRLSQCVHASDCGRVCERLVKWAGKAGVFCVDVKTGEKTLLYPALERPEFHCPEGRF